MRGKVKWFNNKKGYGFITDSEGGGDIFVHYTGILKDGYKSLNNGQLVEYEIIDVEKGLQAVNVEVINEIVEIGEKEIMMNKKQIIEKIVEKYNKYRITNIKEIAEELYNSAVQAGVPNEMIYAGMKMMFNQALGIDNTETIDELGEGVTENAVNETRKANPTVTNKGIAKNFKEELEDNFDWSSLEISSDITNAIKKSTESFIKSNE